MVWFFRLILWLKNIKCSGRNPIYRKRRKRKNPICNLENKTHNFDSLYALDLWILVEKKEIHSERKFCIFQTNKQNILDLFSFLLFFLQVFFIVPDTEMDCYWKWKFLSFFLQFHSGDNYHSNIIIIIIMMSDCIFLQRKKTRQKVTK